jgi:putative membrane-bound dehydrogenase-like protein
MRSSILAYLAVFAWTASALADGGFAPEEAARRMVVPDGFRVETFASEPEIRQPVAACFDERGRMWVIEYLQYPVPAGLKPVTVDQYLRTEYDRVPEPPPKGPRGADRIKILEDTDGDGRADKVTTFLEGLNLASAIAVGNGGVYVGQAPYLLFYADRNRDDKPDGDPEVLVSGFGLQDAHATVNSLAWGPDGWLYGAQGSTVTAKINGIEFQQGIWRFHPVKKTFELFAEGGGNTWGLDFDREGNAFGSSNGSYILFHMVQGANYVKGFAKHGPLHNPRAFGYFNALAYDGPKVGGHVTPGGILYKGGQFPPEYENQFLGGNLLSNAVYRHDLKPDGATFRARHALTFLDARDPWFRPIDLLTGPDGSLFVVDWYDRRASHLDPRDDWDKTNGRVYKISYREPKPLKPFDLSTESTERLLELRDDPNDWWASKALRVLWERGDRAGIARVRAALDSAKDNPQAWRQLCSLDACGGLDPAQAREFLNDKWPARRRWAVRRIGDRHDDDPATIAALLKLAATEPDVTVRAQLASTCQRLPAADAAPILLALAQRSEDADDAYVPLLIWWGLERVLREGADPVAQAFGDPSFQELPIVQRHLLERTARALATQNDPRSAASLVAMLHAAEGGARQAAIFRGIDLGLEGRRQAAPTEALAKAVEPIFAKPAADATTLRAGVRLGSKAAKTQAIHRATDSKTPDADRVALIELLGQEGSDDARICLLGILAQKNSPPGIQGSVLNALGGFANDDAGTAIIDAYPKLDASRRATAIAVLSSRPSWSLRMLDAIGEKVIPATDLKATQVTQILRRGDPAFRERLTAVWGQAPSSSSEAMTKRVAEIRGVLPEGDKGVAARGREVFVKNCGVCHTLFGEGEKIGPELTGSERGDLDFLLTSLIDPSALIRKEYQAQSVALKDGRVLNGLIVEESESALTLLDSQRQKTVVPRTDIEETQPSATSVMPEGILDPLPPDQIRDLFRYLQSSGPPAQ